MMRVVIAVFILLATAFIARANDSEAELALGGLTLKQSDAISLESEDLFLSKAEVRVKYLFRNTSTKDVETLVAFPLPDQVFDENGDMYYRDLRNGLGFETKVDGKPVSYTIVEQAIHQGVDVTARITGLGLPLNDNDDRKAFTAKAAAIPTAEREKLEADGLLLKQEFDAGQGPQVAYQQSWGLRMTVTRTQVFPAGKSVMVEHRYVPMTGGSLGANWNEEVRNEDWFKTARDKFCVDDSWLAGFDKALLKYAKPGNTAPYAETWLGYVLSSGANWKGPIKDFRLVVDKGKEDSLVSFCAEGVMKISPTQFEVRKTNYEPKADINVLIVDWWK